MSYINDALKKAQKEKDGLYKYYHTIIWAKGGGREKGKKRRTLILCGAAVFVLVIVGVVAYKLIAGPGVKAASSTAVRREVTGERMQAASRESSRDARKQMAAEDVPKLYEEALSFQRAKDAAGAERAYRRLLRVEPRHARALNNLGVIYMSRREYGRAAMMFERASMADEKYTDAYYNLACVYSQTKDAGKALENLKKAFALDPAVRTWAERDGDLEPLRSQAGYKEVFSKK